VDISIIFSWLIILLLLVLTPYLFIYIGINTNVARSGGASFL